MSTGNSPVEAIVVNTELNKCATASNGVIRFFDLNTWTENATERFEIQKGCGKITKLHWTSDGSIMSVTTSNGYFLGFLTIVPSLCSAYDIYAALLSSLTEISLVECTKSNVIIAKTDLEMEPNFLNMGVQHFAYGINNQIWYYKWRSLVGEQEDGCVLVCKRDHFGTIKQVVMNDTWTAVLTDGKVVLHCIED